MYLIDFFQRMTRKANIPVLIYLILNVCIIGGIVSLLFMLPVWQGFLLGLLLYAISLAVALSPIGEGILRFQTGCKKISKQEHLDRIEPIFREVYDAARKKDSTIAENVQLYISEDAAPNAFATGRRTVCVTEGLMNLSDEMIRATLGHEFGHLAHKDTDLILLVSVGNMMINGVIIFTRVCIEISHIIFAIISMFMGGEEGLIGMLLNSLYHMMITAIVSGLTWLWTKLGVLLVMKSSRSNEYEADQFSYELGYGQGLLALFDVPGTGSQSAGLFANLASSHPATSDRIARVEQLMRTNPVSYIASVPTPAAAPISKPVPTPISAGPAAAVHGNAAAFIDTAPITPPAVTAPPAGRIRPNFCTACGKKLYETGDFCIYCGKKIQYSMSGDD